MGTSTPISSRLVPVHFYGWFFMPYFAKKNQPELPQQQFTRGRSPSLIPQENAKTTGGANHSALCVYLLELIDGILNGNIFNPPVLPGHHPVKFSFRNQIHRMHPKSCSQNTVLSARLASSLNMPSDHRPHFSARHL